MRVITVFPVFPFFEPRAVASVPRTVDRFRLLPSFRKEESASSGTVRGTLATARGSRNGDPACLVVHDEGGPEHCPPASSLPLAVLMLLVVVDELLQHDGDAVDGGRG